MLAAIEDDINKRFGGTDHMENIHMEIAHTKNPEAAEDLKQQIIEKFGVTEVEPLSVVTKLACHIGPGSIAVACSKLLTEKIYIIIKILKIFIETNRYIGVCRNCQ